jgi:hypothetical protein
MNPGFAPPGTVVVFATRTTGEYSHIVPLQVGEPVDPFTVGLCRLSDIVNSEHWPSSVELVPPAVLANVVRLVVDADCAPTRAAPRRSAAMSVTRGSIETTVFFVGGSSWTALIWPPFCLCARGSGHHHEGCGHGRLSERTPP